MGTLGRHNRVAASRLLQGQLAPLETQQQGLQNREDQLNQRISNMNNEINNISALGGSASPQQIARLAVLQGPVTDRNSLAYAQNELTTIQTNLANATNEVNRIRGIITANQLTNPGNPISNPVTGRTRDARADEQNY